MTKFLIITFSIFFAFACQMEKKKEAKVEQVDSLSINKDNQHHWNELIRIKEIISTHNCSEFSIPYYLNDKGDSLKLTLFTDSSFIRAIKYPIFDIVGNFKEYQAIYFDKQHLPFVVEQLNTDSIQFFDIKNGLFSNKFFASNIEKHYYWQYSKDAEKQCEFVKTIDNFARRFSVLGKYTIVPCIEHNSIDYIVNKDKLPIYSEPNFKSKVLNNLDLKTNLKYIKADSVTYIDEKSREYYFFILVKYNSNDSGWVNNLSTDLFVNEERD